MAGVGIFLIIVALVVGIAGCGGGDGSVTYTLTIASTVGGSVTTPGEAGPYTYDEGEEVNLVATPDAGCRFVNWTGDVDDIADADAATTITMNDDYSITANFEEMPDYDLTISYTEGGEVTTPGEGTFTYYEGTKVNLEATPDACYKFVNWTGDTGTIADVEAASTTITMNGDYDIAANFEEEAVTFADSNLEAVVREAIGKPKGPIYPSDLDGLTNLSAREKNIADLTGLECCTSLTRLDLAYNQISDISPLANLTSLTWLNLYDNQISDISPLASLTSLTWLNLRNNQISDISPLANLTSLTYLSLYRNKISDISPLANLTSLTTLSLGSNQIRDISALANLTSLTWLDLYSNQISNISTLANFTSLTWLNLGSNQISDISALANLTNLTTLELYRNQISDISPLANLTNLTRLWLYSNQISDILPLVNNPGLSEGDTVDLRWNPLSDTSIDTYIPQLEARGVTVDY